MKCIGVITGGNAEAALYYSEILHREARLCLGPRASAHVLAYHLGKGMAGLSDTQARSSIAAVAQKLEAAGAEQVLLGVPEFLAFADGVAASVRIPVQHVCRVTAKVLGEFKFSRVGLIGTRNTIEEEMWERYLREFGCAALLPAPAERDWVCACLESERPAESNRAGFVRIVAELRHAGANAVVLCTPEINRYLRDEDSLLPLVCAAEQQIRASMTAALGLDEVGR
jgi:aspartate racemase